MDGAHRTLAGRYELTAVIGRGGMGVVYRATDLLLGRTVAVKVLLAALAEEDPAHVARFEREARSGASLAHSGVIAVYDTGIDEDSRFIVMEHVAGRSLAAILRDDAPLDPLRAVNIAELLADALAAAHAAGIVHRDVKPANVMLTEEDAVKVLDFGIARILNATALTHSASVLGTAPYMAPEQALGERADERSDIYSLGCLLYAMLTGRPPFTGEPAAVIHQHVNAAARPPSQVNPSVWGALDELVIGMLAKSPDARPQSAAEVRDRLHEQSAKTNTPPGTAITQVLGGGTVRRRRLSAVAALVGVILAVLLILALTTGGHPASAGHRGSGASNGTLRRASSRAPLPTRSTTTAGAPHASNTATGAPTVAASAGALTALITQDVGLAAIDQPSAGQITNRLNAILGSYEMGHVTDARQELADLSQQIATLEGQGHITSAAAAPLRAAIASLGSAFGESSAETQTQSGQPPEAPGQDGEGPGQAAEAPGQDGEPPGQAKKHGRSHENPEGD